MDTEIKTGLCTSCKLLKPVAFVDDFDREFCEECSTILLAAQAVTNAWMYEYLMATIPFKVGDKVECRTAGVLYDGIGTVEKVSFDPAEYGTPVYPSFYCRIEEKAYPEAPDALYYTETCLQHVEFNKENK
jgi:hypothetical protein